MTKGKEGNEAEIRKRLARVEEQLEELFAELDKQPGKQPDKPADSGGADQQEAPAEEQPPNPA